MYDKQKLCDILTNSEYKTVDAYGKIFPPSHNIYSAISQRLLNSGSHVTAKHIYTILKNDRNGIYSAVLKSFNINKKANIENNGSEDSTLSDSNVSYTPHPKTCKQFKLIISGERWTEIKPTRQTYGRNKRQYLSLKSHKWTNILADKIWQQEKLPCAFTFKRGKIYISSDAKCYASFKGMCKECNAQLTGVLYNKPIKKNDAVFECTLTGFSTEVQHKKKRHLRGFLRKEIANELLEGHQSASVYRNKEAKRLMTFGDDIPPTLFDATVLRKAKQEESDKRLQVQTTDPLYNLHIAKCSYLFGVIHNIGLSPFYCMYWTPQQLLMYKKANKQENCFLTIDATGSIGKRLRLPNGEKSPHLFLYECMCVSDFGSFPAFQMVSAKQDASTISYFLSEILRLGAPIPRIVVTDFGKAILVAISRVFANCRNLNDYLQICYYKINNINSCEIPQCYLRLDISHFMGMIAKWDCLRKRGSKVRQFFLRCLGLAYQMQSFMEVHNFLKSMLIVTLSEEIGIDETGLLLLSETHLRAVNNVIKGFVVSDNFEDVDEKVDDQYSNNQDYIENEEIVTGSWATWAKSLFCEAQEISRNSQNGSVVNAYYIPEAAKKIISLMNYLPLWTGIMKSHFKRGPQIATSSFVEAEFSELKSRVFRNRLPMRIDKFIISHIEYLEGRLLLIGTSGNQKSEINKKNPDLNDKYDNKTKNNNAINHSRYEDVNKNDILQHSLNEIENWRCKVKGDKYVIGRSANVPNKEKPNYLKPCADWDLISTHKTFGIPIFKNGNNCCATTIEGNQIVIRETCAFDSIFQVVANGIAMRDSYKIDITASYPNNQFIKLIKDILTRGTIIANHYSTRAKILCDIPIFHKKIGALNISSLNANCNAAHLAEYIFRNMPSCTTEYNCDKCSYMYNKTSPTININVDVLLKRGLNHMQEAIDDDMIMRKETRCYNCKQSVRRSIIYGSHLVIDTSIFSDENYTKAHNIIISTKSYILDNLSKLVVLEDNHYILAGVVTYINYGDSPNNGHYVAFTYSNGGQWYKYDDLTSKRSTANFKEEICPHVIVYVKN